MRIDPPHRASSPRRSSAWRAAAVAFLFSGCQEGAPVPASNGAAPSGASPSPPCAAFTYFASTARPRVFSRCAACHAPGGESGGTRFVLSPRGAPNAEAADFASASAAARALQHDGASLLLLKPTGKVPHGGGVVIAKGSPEETVLEEAVRRLLDPALTAACSGGAAPTVGGVVLADGRRTVRKAAIELAGRLPTDAELQAAAAGDAQTLEGLDAVLLGMMREDAFYDRLGEMWNDLLLTDKSRYEATDELLVTSFSVPPRLLAAKYCDKWQSLDERVKTPESTECIGAAEALAREPLEMIAHVVRGDRPFSEILTAQYRLFNVYAATLFGLELAPFAGHEDDPRYFVETRFPAMHGPGGVPEEYAGILTTNSFLFRYWSTGSNRNRGRAHQVFKLFLDHDVMKSAPRLDLSSVDPSKNPWRHDAQCTGCHAGIDAVAGAFQHWTDCRDIHPIEYFARRWCDVGPWFSGAEMFSPGVGAGEANRLSREQIPTALAHLAAAITKDPAFARAVAAHVLTNLTGHPRLSPPSDPGDPGYAALSATYDAQATTIDALAQGFVASGLDFKKLVIAVVKTPAFRAVDADRAGRMELTGLGGGSLLTPEVLHRKIGATLGATWSDAGPAAEPWPSRRDPPHNLLSLRRFRIFAGGIDSLGVRRRARAASSVSMAVATRMALELACERTAFELAQDRRQRRLFPLVDRDLAPTGDPRAPGQRPILDNLRYLHARLWGEADEAEVLATYRLLADLQSAGAAAVAAGREPRDLVGACAAKTDWATGAPLPAERQLSADPDYTVRAWQGVVAYMLMDYRFLTEE